MFIRTRPYTFTTFSPLDMELIQSNKVKLAIIYVITSVILAAISAVIGF
ncbi:hypothetical protein GCM10008025_24550 [Ornithinibacillus halotolerans]|uniref:Uncharacterized protein n=2 Tax=Ornithinibacillus halotolerans TaxID=1274357 RepID=A0A916WAB3_9BACI|nr:hypothetical protein GCM10008025_24550 [Ornithinibacillus halotolerans]